MYYGFVYITTNLINNKKYIGKRKIRNVKSDSTYLGSGKDLKKDIELYGVENFKRDILEYCVNEDDLRECELKWLKMYNASKNNIFYNKLNNSSGGVIYESHPKGFKNKHHSDKTKHIQSQTMKKVNELGLNTNWKNGHPKGMKNKSQTDFQKEFVGNGRVRIYHTDGTITEHLSVTTASKDTNIPRNVLRKILRDKKPYNTPKNFKKTHYI